MTVLSGLWSLASESRPDHSLIFLEWTSKGAVQRWYGHFPRTQQLLCSVHLQWNRMQWNHPFACIAWNRGKCDYGLFPGPASHINGAVSAQVQSLPCKQYQALVLGNWPVSKRPVNQSRGYRPNLTLRSECTTWVAWQGSWEPFLGETLMVLDQLCRLWSFSVLWFLHLYNGCSQLPRSVCYGRKSDVIQHGEGYFEDPGQFNVVKEISTKR